MNSMAEDWTLLPELRDWLDRTSSAAGPALLRGPDGSVKALPPEVYEALLVVIRALSEGKAVSVASRETTLTTQEAADVLAYRDQRRSRRRRGLDELVDLTEEAGLYDD